MRVFPTLLACWLLTGFGAAAGSIVGNAAGTSGLKIGAILGGIAGLMIAVTVAGRLDWLPSRERTGAFLGGLAGFAVAVPITLSHMHTPLIPIASCGLAGVGALIGAGFARGMEGPR